MQFYVGMYAKMQFLILEFSKIIIKSYFHKKILHIL